MPFALITAEEKLKASGSLFGLAVDVEMQGYSGKRREWKIDDDVAPKITSEVMQKCEQHLPIHGSNDCSIRKFLLENVTLIACSKHHHFLYSLK